MIKYTYKGVEHTVNSTTTTLTTAQKYLEDNIIIEADGSGVTPSGDILITKNGTYDVTDKATATVNVAGGGSQYPIIEGTGKHEVRFVDYDGTLIKVQYVNDGESATAPELPAHDRLTFVEWNREYNNITHDLDVGAIYEPTSGNTEYFIEVTEETGLTVIYHSYRLASKGTIVIDWGDGSTSTLSTSTQPVPTSHTYSSYREYMISVIASGDVTYALGSNTSTRPTLAGDKESNVFRLIKKIYCSRDVTRVYSSSLYNHINLEELTVVSATQFSGNVCNNTKQKAIILPTTVTSLSNRVATFCDRLEYFIFPTNLTNISGPVTNNTKIKKLIYPENWKQTAYTYMAWYENLEYIWYAKPDSNYTFGSSCMQYCPNLKYVPIYDNFEGTTVGAVFWASNIKKIAIPPSTTAINNTFLYQSGGLTDVYMYPHTPPTLGSNCFGSGNGLLKIHVFPEDLEAYQNATNWSGSQIKPKLVGDLEGEFKDGYCQKISRN